MVKKTKRKKASHHRRVKTVESSMNKTRLLLNKTTTKKNKQIRQLGSLQSILVNNNTTTQAYKLSLLDQYLQSSTFTKTNSKNKSYRMLDLTKLIGTQGSTTASVRQLGSLSQILTQKKVEPKTKNDLYIPNIYQQKNPWQKNETTTQEKKNKQASIKDVSVFVNTKKTPQTQFKHFSLITLGIFTLGLCIFILSQLINRANLNFAAQTSHDLLEASVPRILTFQGRLTDFDHNSITQLKNMTFTMYNTSGGNTPPPVGGKILWDSGLCQISPNQHGVFTVNLGAGAGKNQDNANCGATLGNIFVENNAIWLQITVENEILFPRQLIKSIPYALNSETLQGYHASQSATANTIPVLDAQGNLNFNTPSTSLINFGDLKLISQTGDLYLLPGTSNIYFGTPDNPANLIISGDATLAGKLDLSTSAGEVLVGVDGLHFKSQIGQNLWQNQLSLTQQGYLGLGTKAPTQKLSLYQGNLQFLFHNGPDLDNLKLTEDIIKPNTLSRLPAPTKALQLQTTSQGNQHLTPGKYQYAYTFVAENGAESDLSPWSQIEIIEAQSVLLNEIETYNLTNVVARRIYRSKAGSNQLYLLKTITDNLSTSTIDTYTDDRLEQTFSNYHQSGTYHYKITFATTTGESMPSVNSAMIKINGNDRVIKIDNLPLAREEDHLLSRNVYRSLVDSQQYHLVATIEDNSTTTIFDNLPDQELATRPKLNSAGGIYANQTLALQLQSDGTITTASNLIAEQRIETKHGENQGFKLPSSLGKPQTQAGQQIGDIVYDQLNHLLYIYNGNDFVAINGTPSDDYQANLNQDSTYCNKNFCRLILEPEYAGAVITGDGQNNDGIYSSGTETIATNQHFNFYHWVSSTNQLQDFDNTINLTLPHNFMSWQEQGVTLDYLTHTDNSQDNALNLYIYNNRNNQSFSKINQVSTENNTWMSALNDHRPLIITNEELQALDFKAGDRLTLRIKTFSQQNHQVKIGQINFNYHANPHPTNQDHSLWRQLAGSISLNTPADLLLGGDSTASAKIAFLNLTGNGTPTLHLKGNLFLANPNKNNYLDLASQSSFHIRTQNLNQSYSEVFTILPNGNIGLGINNPTEKLDIKGNVRISGSLQLSPQSQIEAGICNQEYEGKIYYDYHQLKFFGCQAQDLHRQSFSWTPLN